MRITDILGPNPPEIDLQGLPEAEVAAAAKAVDAALPAWLGPVECRGIAIAALLAARKVAG